MLELLSVFSTLSISGVGIQWHGFLNLVPRFFPLQLQTNVRTCVPMFLFSDLFAQWASS